jgi:diacylglycerol kinase family enzyme
VPRPCAGRGAVRRPRRALSASRPESAVALPGCIRDDLPVPLSDPGLAAIIASPSASRLRDADERDRVISAATRALHRRGHDRVIVTVTGEPAALRAAAADAVSGGASTVVLAGGDGTVRDASSALAGSGVAVGLLPCGTGNLYAASVGVPRALDRAIAALVAGTPRPFDLGDVRLERDEAPAEAVPFVVACGTGFDAHVMGATSRDAKLKFGVAAYFLAASRLLEHLRPQPTVITVDGVRTELESVVVLVASAGGGIPGALQPRLPISADDGLLHTFVLPRGGVLGGMRGVVELLLAGATGPSATGAGYRLAGKQVRVEVQPPGPVEVDGDTFAPATLEATVRPGALLVIRA